MEISVIITADVDLAVLTDLLDPADSSAGAVCDSFNVWLTLPWCYKVTLIGLSRGKFVVPTLDVWKLASRGGYILDFGPASDPSWRLAIESLHSATSLAQSLGGRSLTRIS
jgi:hypothetical protein